MRASGPVANLDHLRWIAALAVVLQHARALVMVDYHPGAGMVANAAFFVTGFSHQAVIIFFVLSGYLVGGAALRLILEQSSHERRRRFAVDRFTRVAVVLWPALALTAIIALVMPLSPVVTTAGWSADLPNITEASRPIGWAVAMLLVNEIVAPTIAYDTPLWSLAYEWTYYVVAAAAIFLTAKDRTALGLVTVVYAFILLALSAWAHPHLLWSMTFWLLGAAASRITRWRNPVFSIMIFAAVLLLSRFGIPAGLEDITVALATALLITDRWFREGQAAARTAAALASFSFSLYVVHWPVMLLVVAVAQRFGLLAHRLPAGPAAYLAILLLALIVYPVALLFAAMTEQRTNAIRARLARRRVG